MEESKKESKAQPTKEPTKELTKDLSKELTKELTKENIIEQIKTVEDPEIHMNVYDLGLIYDIKIKDTAVNITMTLTSPMCPYGPELIGNVKESVRKIGGEPVVDLTFNPPWEPNDDVRMELGLL